MIDRRLARPMYEVYLERVIKIPTVQDHRAAAVEEAARYLSDDDMTAHFFSEGYHDGPFGPFRWFLDAPRISISYQLPRPLSLPMQAAWDATFRAFEEWWKEIIEGGIAEGMCQASGVPSVIKPAGAGLILDPHAGDLFRKRNLVLTVLYTGITLQAKSPARLAASPHSRGRKPLVNWKMVDEQVIHLMTHYGEFSDDDPEWNAQARLEEAIENFCEEKFDKCPGPTQLREHVRESLERWRQSKSET